MDVRARVGTRGPQSSFPRNEEVPGSSPGVGSKETPAKAGVRLSRLRSHRRGGNGVATAPARDARIVFARMSTAETPTRLLRVPEVAQRLRMSRASIDPKISAGDLPALRIGLRSALPSIQQSWKLAPLGAWPRRFSPFADVNVPAERGVPAQPDSRRRRRSRGARRRREQDRHPARRRPLHRARRRPGRVETAGDSAPPLRSCVRLLGGGGRRECAQHGRNKKCRRY